MKISTKITDITHDDLVDLFSTATYGSSWFGIRRPKGSYRGTELEDENDCREDTWAKVLLNGGKVYFCDFYAEDEEDFYGTKNHAWRGDCMRYEINLDDIKYGLEKAFDSGGHIARRATRLMDRDNLDFDIEDAESLIQIIMFGEEVYG